MATPTTIATPREMAAEIETAKALRECNRLRREIERINLEKMKFIVRHGKATFILGRIVDSKLASIFMPKLHAAAAEHINER